MPSLLSNWFRSPVFPEDVNKTRSALLLNVILNTFFIALLVILITVLLVNTGPRPTFTTIVLTISWLGIFGLQYIMRKGQVKTAGILAAIILYLATSLEIYNIGTIRAPATAFYILIIVLAGLVINRQAIAWTAFINGLTIIILLICEMKGLLPKPNLGVSITQGITFVTIVLITSILLYLATGSIEDALTQARTELAERKQVELAMRESEEKYRTLFETAKDAIIVFNQTNTKIIDVNQTACQLYRYDSDEFLRLYVRDISAEIQATNEAIRRGATHVPLRYHKKKDGTIFPVEITAAQFSVADKAIQVAFVRDITTRLRAEKEREAYIEELGRQNAELERFTYTVSHDLRNPLVTIKGFLGAIERDLSEGRQDRIQHDFQRIAKAADKMEALLSQLLELSRVGRIINPPEDINLLELTHEALENLHTQLNQKQIQAHVAIDLPVVHADRIRLLEVLVNLIDNAAKYMGDQPNPQIEIGLRVQAGEQVIFVRDNGMGIEPLYQTKIFGLFEKLDATMDGTGIGLALVKRIIETHGGRIWVESEGLGRGSMFCFTIADTRK